LGVIAHRARTGEPRATYREEAWALVERDLSCPQHAAAANGRPAENPENAACGAYDNSFEEELPPNVPGHKHAA